MRYDEFRDRWQIALRAMRLLTSRDGIEETIDTTTTERCWTARPLPRPVEPFHVGARISFRWNPFDSARSYTCEEDLLTELFERTKRRSTERRLLRVDITLQATLPHGSMAPMPAPDVWLSWVASVGEQLDTVLTSGRGQKGAGPVWRGDVEIEGGTAADGTFSLHGIAVSAFDMLVIPRIWSDSNRQAKEAAPDRGIDGLAIRFHEALDAWKAGVGELARWLKYARGASRDPSRPRRRAAVSPKRRNGGPETTH